MPRPCRTPRPRWRVSSVDRPYPGAVSELAVGGVTFDLERRFAVMAIVNRTPDSFYDRGATFALDAAVAAGVAAVADGRRLHRRRGSEVRTRSRAADRRRDRAGDPRRAGTRGAGAGQRRHVPSRGRAGGDRGRSDASSTTRPGSDRPAMADVVAAGGATIVIAHSLAPAAHPVPAAALRRRRRGGRRVPHRAARSWRWTVACRADRIVLDPGHDLNKNTLHSLELTRRLDELTHLGAPLLVALSNKDFIGETLARDRGDRVAGSIAAAVVCALQGARIVRTHNVRETVDALRMVEAVLGWREPAYLAAQHATRGERLMPSRTSCSRRTRCRRARDTRVRMNFVQSADGAATLGGRSGPLGGEHGSRPHAGAADDGGRHRRRRRHGARRRLRRRDRERGAQRLARRTTACPLSPPSRS